MMPKFAAETGSKILYRLDRIAHYVRANHKAWGMPEADAIKLVNAVDITADEIEVATFGEESLKARQAKVLTEALARQANGGQPPAPGTAAAPAGTPAPAAVAPPVQRTAEVIKKEPDEPYMATFSNPMAPIQVESDEPYMRAYGPPDQSSAVIHGTSTSGRPLTPHK
jgi:hypothetical protein